MERRNPLGIKRLFSTNQKPAVRWTIDIICTIFGSFLFALSTHMFSAPNHFAPGGVTGISTIINFLTGIPIGTMTIIINVPIVILGVWKIGWHYMLRSIISILAYSISIDFVLVNVPVYTNDKMIACIFGGVLMGCGVGIVMSRGGSTGGMDIINKLIQRRFPHLKLGQVTFSTDMVIVATSAVAFGSLEPALYSLVCLFISATALDTVLYGFNKCKALYIVSQKHEELCRRIHSEMNRGATVLRSYGSYTNEERPTIMVAVKQTEYYKLRKIVQQTDPNAFIIMTSASEIVGEGFATGK